MYYMKYVFFKINLGSNPPLVHTRGRRVSSQDIMKLNLTLDFIKFLASLKDLAKQKDGTNIFIVSALFHSKQFYKKKLISL
jgi:hypothetical protein